MPDSFKVVINHEEQYSVWPADQRLPPGWREVATKGTGEECLRYIQKVWKDMSPRDLSRIKDIIRRK